MNRLTKSFITIFCLLFFYATSAMIFADDFENYEAEFKQLHLDAESGNADAQVKLGTAYRTGDDVDGKVLILQNYAEAVKWYKKSAAQGNILAHINMGIMYYKGYGVRINYSEAFKRFRKGAEIGDFNAQEWLGSMYKDGLGVKKNLVLAYVWFSVAVILKASRAPDAKKHIDELAPRLTTDEMNRAQRLIAEYVEKYSGKNIKQEEGL